MNKKIINFLRNNCINAIVYAPEPLYCEDLFPYMTFIRKPEKYAIVVASEISEYECEVYKFPAGIIGKKEFTGNYTFTHIYEIIPKVKLDKYNPEIVVKNYGYSVFQDNVLVGGTKQRGTKCFLEGTLNKVVYAGPSTGAAQVALAYMCKELGKKFYMFSDLGKSELYHEAKKLGAEFFKSSAPLKEQQKQAEKWAEENKAYVVPFGLESEKFRNCLKSAIWSALPEKHRNPRRLWLVGGSATLLGILYSIFPQTFFCVVQVGKKIWLDQIDNRRTRVFVSPYKFYQPTKNPPPYKSVIFYDAKVWEFVKKYGEKGDYIWNVK